MLFIHRVTLESGGSLITLRARLEWRNDCDLGSVTHRSEYLRDFLSGLQANTMTMFCNGSAVWGALRVEQFHRSQLTLRSIVVGFDPVWLARAIIRVKRSQAAMVCQLGRVQAVRQSLTVGLEL
jgi:hypothetical protein